MTDGMMDIQADLLKDAIKNATGQIRLMFKDKKPFRMVKQSPKQQLKDYLRMPEEQKDFYRNEPSIQNDFAQKEMDMNDLILKEGQDGRIT